MNADERRGGGRLTFVAFLVLGFAFIVGAGIQAGPRSPNPAVFIIFVAILAVGAIIGAFVGFYNMGRKRGR